MSDPLQSLKPLASFGKLEGVGDLDTNISNLGGKIKPTSLSTNYFSNGASMGQASGLASGIAGAVGFGQNMADEINYYKNMEFTQALDIGDGMPSSFGMSNMAQQMNGINIADAGKGMVGKGATSGAQLGAAVGSFLPGAGTIIGAGVGALVGGIAGAFGKKAAQKKADAAKDRALTAFENTQDKYNTNVSDYYQGVDAKRQDAQRDFSRQQSMYGLGNFNSPFASIV